jgi:egghead protein (zeste-white 4 protein)
VSSAHIPSGEQNSVTSSGEWQHDSAASDFAGRIRLGWLSFAIAFALSLAAMVWQRVRSPEPGLMGWYVTIVWTIPLIVSVQGFMGAMAVRRRVPQRRSSLGSSPLIANLLVVVVPSIARRDTIPALRRVIESLCTWLPSSFSNLRVDIFIEEGAEGASEVVAMAAESQLVRVVTIPSHFIAPNGSLFKGRANHFAHLLRIAEGEARPDVWILHMDDDTGVSASTTESLAAFILGQGADGPDRRDLAQGILAYPREYSTNRLTWLADSVRPGCDVSVFALSTGGGTPRVGLHGELLLVRSSVESEIGWDFGPMTLVEDAHFALEFCERYPGRSAWIEGLSYGASPSSVRDFVKQRARWVWGLLHLATQRKAPLRVRALLVANVFIWACSPLGHPVLLLVAGAALGEPGTTPPTALVGAVWSFNFAFYIWLYWEGLKINARASSTPARKWWEPACLLFLSPLFAIWECMGICLGVFRFLTKTEAYFSVIVKPN